jgi:uncharacterized membrane protein
MNTLCLFPLLLFFSSYLFNKFTQAKIIILRAVVEEEEDREENKL